MTVDELRDEQLKMIGIGSALVIIPVYKEAL